VHALHRALLLGVGLVGCGTDVPVDVPLGAKDVATTEGGASTTESGPVGSTSNEHGSSTESTTTLAMTGDAGTTMGDAATTDETGTTTGDAGTLAGDAGTSGDAGTTTGDAGVTTDDAGTSESSRDGSESSSNTGGSSSDSGDDEATGGDGCDADWETHLLRGHRSSAQVDITATRLLSHSNDKTILWDRATREVLMVDHEWGWAELEGDLVLLSGLAEMRWLDADDGTLLGTTTAGTRQGLGRGGAYLWRANAEGISWFDATGAEIGFQPGDFSQAWVLAREDALHVHAALVSASTVLDIAIDTGDLTERAFDGTFGGWFSDVPRFWAVQGQGYRVYDVDGAQLLLELGLLWAGVNDYLVGDAGLRPISDATDILVEDVGLIRENVVYSYTEGAQRLVVVTPEGLTEIPLPSSDGWWFDYLDGEYVQGTSTGVVRDDTGELYSRGELLDMDGARSGRIVAASATGRTYLWDVESDCAFAEYPDLARASTALVIADDGDAALSLEPGYPQSLLHLVSLPDGASLGEHDAMQLPFAVSDDASAYAAGNAAGSLPDFAEWLAVGTEMHVAPHGAHAVSAQHYLAFGQPELSYVIDPGGLIEIFEGHTYGFIDDTRVLAGFYDSPYCDGGPYVCEEFLGTSILELDGSLVQETTLPEAFGFMRVTDTEIFIDDPPRIFDVYSGELLWTGSTDLFVVPLGADFIAASDGGDLTVRRWR
jgi:hypothetical protein